MTYTSEQIDIAHDLYMSREDEPCWQHYAATVGRFQEGFLRDKVCTDVDQAFARAVEAAERAISVIKERAAMLARIQSA